MFRRTVLLLILFLILPDSISSLFRICPVKNQWLDFRYSFLCNQSPDMDCNNQNRILEELNRSSVILFHKQQWKTINKLVENFSLCGIRNFVMNPDIENNGTFNQYCWARDPMVVFPLMEEEYNFVEMYQGLENCEIANVSIDNYLFLKMSHRCPHTMWLIGSVECSKGIKSRGITIQKVFGDTYWDENGRKVLIQNKTLLVGTVVSPPFMTKTVFNDTYWEYSGIVYELLKTVAQQVGFNFEIKESHEYGNGLVKMLKNKVHFQSMQYFFCVCDHLRNNVFLSENHACISNSHELLRYVFLTCCTVIPFQEIDFAAASLTITKERSALIDFTASFYYEEIGIMINRPMDQNQADFWKMFSLFPYTVWIAILATTLMSMAILYGLHKFAAIKLNTIFMQWPHCCWYIFSSMLNQPEDMSPQTWSIQNFLTFFWLYAFAILSMYSGGLIAMLTSSKLSVPFDNLDGLADAVKAGEFRVCTVANSAFSSMLINATRTSYKILMDFFDKNPKYLATEDYCIKQLSTSNNLAYLDEMTRLNELRIIHCKTNLKFVILDDAFFPGNLAFATPKSSSLQSILTYHIIDAIEAGMINGWKSNYSEHQHFCALATPNQIVNHIEDKIAVYELGGPFVLLLIGLITSILVFFFELYKILHLKRKRSKIKPTSANSSFSLRFQSRTSPKEIFTNQVQRSLLS